MKKVSIVIPVYNEKSTILKILEEVEKSDTLGLEKEIILVDDGSINGTKEILKNLETKYQIIYHQQNLGKGAAVRTGFGKATGDIILIQDADLELNPENYPKILKPILSGETEVVYSSRYQEHNPTYYYRHYYLGGKLISYLTNIFYGSKLSDVYCGYKVFKADVLKSLELESNGFGIEQELTIKTLKKGYKIKEVSISYYPRTREEGKKIRWWDGLEAVWLIIKYKFIS
jgi:glycosyltransferase involved in cell wall biosynthesis